MRPRSPRSCPFPLRVARRTSALKLVLLLSIISKAAGAARARDASAIDLDLEDPGNDHHRQGLPLVVHTWPWTQAARAGYAVFEKNEKRSGPGPGAKAGALLSLEAAVATAERAELDRCDGSVGPGGNTDESGRVSLDALVMDGETMRAGGVAAIRVSQAAATARLVMETTAHTLLVGEAATEFAHSVGGFSRHQELENNVSDARVASWRERDCQPNFRRQQQRKGGLALEPDPRRSCGPYHRRRRRREEEAEKEEEEEQEEGTSSSSLASMPPPLPSRSSHDTIAVVAIDSSGRAAVAASSNGAAHKVPGRAGDAAVPGGGAYATRFGGCGSTGDGDLHLRYWPCVRAMASLERGMSPREAAEDAVRRIAEREPTYVGALVVACSKTGEVGAAAHGWEFSYTVARRGVRGGDPVVVGVEPLVVSEGGGTGGQKA